MGGSKISNMENARLDIDMTLHGRWRLYPYRYVNLAFFCLAAALNQICWISMQPIVGAIKNGYDVQNTDISLLSIIYMGVFVIFNFPANIALDRRSLRFGVNLGVVLTMVGMWIKVLINRSFLWVILGQMFAAVGQPFLACAPAKLVG